MAPRTDGTIRRKLPEHESLNSDHVELLLRGRPDNIQKVLNGLSTDSATLWNFATSRSIAIVQTQVLDAALDDKLNGAKLQMLSPNQLKLYGKRCVDAATAIGVVISDPDSFINSVKGTQSVQEVGDALYYAGL